MRKLILGMALASTALATPALARDNSWYVEGDLGGVIVQDQNVTDRTTGDEGHLTRKVGFTTGGTIGYDFGRFSLEAETSWQRGPVKHFYTAGDETYYGPGANSNALAFMGNALLNFGPVKGLHGFVGGGVGVARVKEHWVSTPSEGSIAEGVDDSDSGFAWQLVAGVKLPVNDHWDVGLKYRYFDASGAKDYVAVGTGDNLRTTFISHSVLATLTYNFGGPAAPPPPPAPVVHDDTPPPPPQVVQPQVVQPAAPVCNKGPYIVFFDFDKSDVTPEAATILDSAIQAYGNCNNVPIMLAGYTDLVGTQKYNLGLSARRNSSVRAYLTAHGVPDGAISSKAFGKLNPRVPTANGVRELQNRRVEITYGPGSGY